jgi:nucleoside 2-deoxyribosyltransferase
MKAKIYLAGPINACSDDECNKWRSQAKERLSEKYDILDPMCRDYRGTEDNDYKEIVENDLSDIIKSDIILANCYKPSAGTSMELVYAKMMGKKIFSVGSSSPWIKYHSTLMFDDIEKAIDMLDKHMIFNFKEKNDGKVTIFTTCLRSD